MVAKTMFLLISMTLIGLVPLSSAPKHSAPLAHAKTNGNPSLEDLTKNLEFDFCKADIRSGDNEQLNEVAEYIKEKKVAIALRGHADGIGSYLGNWKMSDYRANAVKSYLVNKGVPEDRIVATPFGSTIPIASNKSSSGRQKNRRVEIRLKELH